ncbi:DNA-3-methyladenine glycosylase [Agriterribacter sp.]|uniref:DNA-3-methyladenine glycosylase n=1 Tax=Agriterribacter sp. TaxID=2821509 RepID=UPI002CEF4D91|nr:DNA-3-methyladenine glycosylase [Agriterribacter sp.]HRP56106.1 DNA-3-methyladenine glycosylase [Agriterribacter sp.]
MKKLDHYFYNRADVVNIARELLGKVLVTQWDGAVTSGRIVETEAYRGITDRASHAWNCRRTRRTEIMYEEGGKGYVYLCYGIHHLFNVVTNIKDTPHAVLVRAVEPLEGISTMLQRTGKIKADRTLTSGPGNVSKALGLLVSHSGISLLEEAVFIADDGYALKKKDIVATTRIGVDYAGEDALLPYRFFIRDNIYVSGRRQ